MATDWPWVQRGTTIWTLIAAALIGGVTYLLDEEQITYGLGFGVIIAVVNYRVIGAILNITLRFASPNVSKFLSFLGYHVRFWIIVVLLYIVIPKTGYLFAVGTFIGFVIPKVVMGIFLVISANKEWWTPEKLLKQADSSAPAEEAKTQQKPGPPGPDHDEPSGFNDSEGNLRL